MPKILNPEMPRKLDSLLARFEETIEKNNAAGVCSGMYLTNQASSSSCCPPIKAKTSRRNSLETSLRIQPGTYRQMFKTTDATVSTDSTASTANSDDWDPFCDADPKTQDKLNESFSSIGDCSAASFDDDVDDTASRASKVRRERSKDKKSSGRRSTRITKSQKQRRDSMSLASTTYPLPVGVSLVDPANEDNATGDDEEDDDDDDSGFALTYVSARDKFTALAKQNSDRQLCKQPSRRKLLSGLKMASKGNLSGGSDHSRGSTRQKSIDTGRSGRATKKSPDSIEDLLSGESDHSTGSSRRRSMDLSRSSRTSKKSTGSSATRIARSANLLDNVEITKSASSSKTTPRSDRVCSSTSPQKRSKGNAGVVRHSSCQKLDQSAPLDMSDDETPVKVRSNRTSKTQGSTRDHSHRQKNHDGTCRSQKSDNQRSNRSIEH
jgi:hypothetical protein